MFKYANGQSVGTEKLKVTKSVSFCLTNAGTKNKRLKLNQNFPQPKVAFIESYSPYLV